MKPNYDLKDITVVILSRGREKFLTETLRFWSQVEVNILVLHNAEHELPPSSIPRNTQYILSRLPYGDRCKEAMKHLKTKFAILSSDDEVYLPTGLNDLKNFLENHEEFESVGGVTLAASEYGPMKSISRCYEIMQDYENSNKNQISRLEDHFETSLPWRGGGIYRLMRKGTFTQMLELFSRSASFSTPYIYEVSGEILVNAAGYSKYVNSVYWIRNWVNPAIEHSSWDRKKYFSDWYVDENYKNEVSEWKETMRDYLSISCEEFEKLLGNIRILRASAEAREVQRNNRIRVKLPISLKYVLRSMIAPHTLPPRKSATLAKLKHQRVNINDAELTAAIKAIYS